MKLQGRLQKIKDAKNALDQQKKSEFMALQEKKADFKYKLVPYASRIKDLLAIAQELRANDLPLGERTHDVAGFAKDEFVTEGIDHKFGFFIPYRWDHPHRGELIGLGYMGGGLCGADLLINADGVVIQWSEPLYDWRKDTLENDFLAFEKAVYDYVDSL